MPELLAPVASELLRKGCSDERVEILTGLHLLQILELRAQRATAPAAPGPEPHRRRSAQLAA